jgi:hypothetical protein
METDPAASVLTVTIAMAGTAPLAGVTPPSTTRTPRWVMLVKKAVMKKSMLKVCLLLHSKHSVLVDLYDDVTDFASLGLRAP